MTQDLFFSQATLVLTDRERRPPRGATRPYVIHQLVADLFGEYESRPYLFRATERRGSSQNVLTLSTRPPLKVDEVPGRTFGSVRSIRTKPFSLTVPEGTRLDYEIRINATKDIPREGKKRSKRTDVWDAVWGEDKETEKTPHQVYGAYIQRKLSEVAHLHSTRVTARGFVRARRNLKQRNAITFVAANLIGTMQVEDSVALMQIIRKGIGRSKAFGCGLLCLSRPGTVLPRSYPSAARELY